MATEAPDAFLHGRKSPFAIDECQLAPPLFPALKEAVRQAPARGQFLLTGSVRFASRRAIRESLTGRILNVELLPFSWSECQTLPVSDLPMRLAKSANAGLAYAAARLKLKGLASAQQHLLLGGLPGICFQRSQYLRERRYELHLETLLERDLRLLVESRLSFSSLRGLLVALAARQGKPLDLSDLSRATRISRPTLMSMLRAFEGLFLIRTLPALGGTSRPMIFLEDQGTASYLFRGAFDPLVEMSRLLFANVPHQFWYRFEMTAQLGHYLTRGGAQVALVVEAGEQAYGYLPDVNEAPSRSNILSAQSFLKAYPGAIAIIAHQGTELRELGRGIYSLPLTACL